MIKGKPWAPEEETRLRDWYKTELLILLFYLRILKVIIPGIGLFENCDLGLKDNHQMKKNARCLSSKLNLPAELHSVEEMLIIYKTFRVWTRCGGSEPKLWWTERMPQS